MLLSRGAGPTDRDPGRGWALLVWAARIVRTSYLTEVFASTTVFSGRWLCGGRCGAGPLVDRGTSTGLITIRCAGRLGCAIRWRSARMVAAPISVLGWCTVVSEM